MTFPSRLRSCALRVTASATVALAVAAMAGGTVEAQEEPTTTPTVPVVSVVETTTSTVAPTPPVSVAPVPVVPVIPGTVVVEGGPTSTIETVPVIDGSSTTVDPLATTTTTLPVESTTTTALLVTNLDPGDDDATSEAPPGLGVPVLPAPKVPPRDASLEALLNQLSAQQRKLVAIAQKRADEATARLQAAQDQMNALKARQEAVNAEINVVREQLKATKEKLRLRALAVLAGAEVEQIDSVLSASGASELARSLDIVSAAQKQESKLIETYRSQVATIDARNAELNQIVADKQLEVDTIIAEQQALGDALLKVQEQLASITSGAAIALGGFVFPVGAPFNFVDTFGAPRMTGTKYQHTHEGTDIFSAHGNPLYAVNRGVITRIGVAKLGGNKLWLVAADGTEYYYAHLSAFAEGIRDGTFVDAGQVIGFVGDTGNAKGTPPHLHFEIHPGGGPAVNPAPFLEAVRSSDYAGLLKAAQAANTTVPPATIPGQIRAGVGIVREVAIGEVVAIAAGPTTTGAPGATTPALPYRPVPTTP